MRGEEMGGGGGEGGCCREIITAATKDRVSRIPNRKCTKGESGGEEGWANPDLASSKIASIREAPMVTDMPYKRASRTMPQSTHSIADSRVHLIAYVTVQERSLQP